MNRVPENATHLLVVQCIREFLHYMLHIRGILQDGSSGFSILSAISMRIFIFTFVADSAASFSALEILKGKEVKNSENFCKLDDAVP